MNTKMKIKSLCGLFNHQMLLHVYDKSHLTFILNGLEAFVLEGLFIKQHRSCVFFWK